MNVLSELFRIARENSGMTIRQAADVLLLCSSTVSRYESGKITPPLPTIMYFLHVTGQAKLKHGIFKMKPDQMQLNFGDESHRRLIKRQISEGERIAEVLSPYFEPNHGQSAARRQMQRPTNRELQL